MTLRKGFHHSEKWKINWKFQHLLKADHSMYSIVPLRVSPPVPVAFVVGRLVLHWQHAHVMMRNTEAYSDKWTENQVCELLAHIEGAITRDMSVIP